MKNRVYTSLGLILLLTLLSLPVLAQETISLGSPVSGNLSGDPVLYSIDAQAGQLLIISMQADDFDPLVRIQQNGQELASDDDSGGGYNAQLGYLVPASGSYTISAESSYSGSGEGSFMLNVDETAPTVIEPGSSAILEPSSNGSAHLYAAFDAVEGAVVNIWAISQDDEDVSLRLLGPDSQEIDKDDDDGPGHNALLRRLVLPASGTNLIDVSQSYSDDPLMSPVEVTIDNTEALHLSETPQEVVLGDGEGRAGTEVFTVDVKANTTYRFIVTIQPMPDEDVGIKMELLDTDRFFEPTLEVLHATGTSWDYVPNSSGTIRLDMHPNFFGSDLQAVTYTIAMQVIE